MGKVIDISGCKFGRLTVVEFAGKNKAHEALWRCKCECGNEAVTRGKSLRTGNTKSCGCFMKDQTSTAHHVHGMSGTKLYQIWRAIKKRCKNPNDKEYDIYGGRGITIFPD